MTLNCVEPHFRVVAVERRQLELHCCGICVQYRAWLCVCRVGRLQALVSGCQWLRGCSGNIISEIVSRHDVRWKREYEWENVASKRELVVARARVYAKNGVLRGLQGTCECVGERVGSSQPLRDGMCVCVVCLVNRDALAIRMGELNASGFSTKPRRCVSVCEVMK